MSASNSQELQIVQAFSLVTLPDRVLRNSKVADLVRTLEADRENVKSKSEQLERRRQEKKEGNFLSNLWNDRAENVEDAQLALNEAIGNLTSSTSELLVVNTAISKVLADQQHLLMQQQKLLQQQAQELQRQNEVILEQQTQLMQQQKDINTANQGLLEAKGITQEQAQKLVGCVKRVTETEKKIDAANEQLRAGLEQGLRDAVAECQASVNAGFAKLDEAFTTLDSQLQLRMDAAACILNEEVSAKLDAQGQELRQDAEAQGLAVTASVQALGGELTSKSAELHNLQALVLAMQIKQQRHAQKTRLALVGTAGLAMLGLAWQLAHYF